MAQGRGPRGARGRYSTTHTQTHKWLTSPTVIQPTFIFYNISRYLRTLCYFSVIVGDCKVFWLFGVVVRGAVVGLLSADKCCKVLVVG